VAQVIEPALSWHKGAMTKRRFPIGLSTFVLGLALFGLAPSEAKAIEVMCSNEYGMCEVQDNPSWISCSCIDESSTGGTGGDEYQGLSEAELMAVCEAELAYCLPAETSDGTTTLGTSDTGEGEGTSTSDTGDSTTNGDTGTTNGEEGTTGAEEGTTGGDGGTTGAEEGTTGGDEGTTGGTGGEEAETGGDEPTTSDSGGESGSDGGGDSGTGGDGGDEANDGGGAEGQGGDGDGCSVANDSGFGALALFGMLGLLGLRSRKRAS
jgi:MYXO-CTERM domain-containing protein